MFLKTFKNIIIVTTIALILFIFFLEGLRVLPKIGKIATNINKFTSPLTYEQRYLFSERSYSLENQNSKDPALKFYEHHEVRGWTTKKNLKIYVEGNTYTTNNIGERSLENYRKDESKYEVLVVGDSMTFGEESSDEFVWTNILKKKNKNLNVINLAVPGYGIDQIYLMLKESIKIYKPDLVIFAFVKDDFARAMLPFREAKKPFFKIKNNKLILKNVPLKKPDEVYAELKKKREDRPFYKKLKIYDLYVTLFDSSAYKVGNETRFYVHNKCNNSCLELNEKLFFESYQLAKKNNSDFISLLIPGDKRDRTDQEFKSYADVFLENMKKKYKMDYLNLRPYFYSTYGFVTKGHYQQKGLHLIAETVNKQIISKKLK
tara:strand:+ start:5 stop:1129 length:1125 start_codon:yes stop_codon:yes gene_type:complete